MPVSYQGSVQEESKQKLPNVAEFMTRKLVTLRPEMNVFDAIELFLKHQISGAPVVNEKGKLIGIYTEKDCLKELKNRYYFNQPAGKVGDHMAHNPQTASPGDDLVKVSDIFLYNHFKMVPVVEKDNLLGLVSRRDIIRVMKEYRRSSES